MSYSPAKRCAALAAAMTLPLCAEVFLLSPRGNSGSGAGARQPGDFTVNGTRIMEMPVKANGLTLTLKISKLDLSWQELQRKMSSGKAEFGGDFIRIRRQQSDGSVRRQLFAASNSRTNPAVTLFELTTPPKLPRAQWPKELPQFSGDIQPGLVLDLGKKHGIYAGFSTAQNGPENQLAALSARLRTQGWQAAGAEGTPAIRGKGELFIRNTPQRELLWVSFSQNSGAIFYRPQRTN